MALLAFVYISIAFAAALNAVMDILENENFHASIFKRLNEKFWYKRTSWMFAKKIFRYKIDAWHLSKSAMVISIMSAIFFSKGISFFSALVSLSTGVLWVLIFNLFYYKILKKK